MRIELSKLAVKDLKDVYKYVSHSNLKAAKEQIELILKAVDNLEVFPNIGKDFYTEYLLDKDYKILIVNKTYIVFYYLEKENVVISRIFRKEQDYISKLELIKDDEWYEKVYHLFYFDIYYENYRFL